jgi:hypothetical protein
VGFAVRHDHQLPPAALPDVSHGVEAVVRRRGWTALVRKNQTLTAETASLRDAGRQMPLGRLDGFAH